MDAAQLGRAGKGATRAVLSWSDWSKLSLEEMRAHVNFKKRYLKSGVDILFDFVTYNQEESALHWAVKAEKECFHIVEQLIQAKADVNVTALREQLTPVQWSIFDSDIKVLERLMLYGGSVQARVPQEAIGEFARTLGAYGEASTLHLAAFPKLYCPQYHWRMLSGRTG